MTKLPNYISVFGAIDMSGGPVDPSTLTTTVYWPGGRGIATVGLSISGIASIAITTVASNGGNWLMASPALKVGGFAGATSTTTADFEVDLPTCQIQVSVSASPGGRISGSMIIATVGDNPPGE